MRAAAISWPIVARRKVPLLPDSVCTSGSSCYKYSVIDCILRGPQDNRSLILELDVLCFLLRIGHLPVMNRTYNTFRDRNRCVHAEVERKRSDCR
jgi:hypothetical protein